MTLHYPITGYKSRTILHDFLSFLVLVQCSIVAMYQIYQRLCHTLLITRPQ